MRRRRLCTPFGFLAITVIGSASGDDASSRQVSSLGVPFEGSLLSSLEAFPLNDPWAMPLEDGCPLSCDNAGSQPTEWTRLYQQDQLFRCQKPLLFDFNIQCVADKGTTFRACAAGLRDKADLRGWSRRGPSSIDGSASNMTTLMNWTAQDKSSKSRVPGSSCGAVASTVNASIQAGATSVNSIGEVLTAVEALRSYIQINSPCGSLILFAKAGNAIVGLYAGADLQKRRAVELIDESRHATTLGLFAVDDIEDIQNIQQALQDWAKGKCLDLTQGEVFRKNIDIAVLSAAPVPFPPVHPNFREGSGSGLTENRTLIARSECRVIEVADGDGCAALSTRCGIRGREFLEYNKVPDICTRLMPRQKVCCSDGELPSSRPAKQADGTCSTHKVVSGDTCDAIARVYEITNNEINLFNQQTWGWTGCSNLQIGLILCLTSGNPPLPAPVPGVECGPQKPGTQPPPGAFTGEDLASLNPCPLAACCSRWGFCGTFNTFCGKPGDNKKPPGTGNCISNCEFGTITTSKSPPPKFFKIGYFETYALSRPCDRIDIRTIDVQKYTHIHFAFATIAAGTFEVDMSPIINQFHYFKRLQGVKKILAFGGWAFSTELWIANSSTSPATFGTFRKGVQGQNRIRMAHNIARFIIDHGLDGVDIDWEYPAAPDIPDIPPGSPEEGLNYLRFLITLRQLLPAEKTISIAAPASYWYLKGFPIKEIMKYIDYLVYMTYDLHGQWDYGNKWAIEGCSTGNCLRSHVNMTETLRALSMITKAGVPSNKIVVGVTSYGRSFQMTDADCTGPTCTYTGPKPGAKPGKCTGTSGYLSHSEIRDIIENDATAKTFSDSDSTSNILVYQSTQWVAYMDNINKKAREDKYRNYNFLDTSDWAISLDTDNASSIDPRLDGSCSQFENLIHQAWSDAGEISKGPMSWQRDNKYQGVLDLYLGERSRMQPVLPSTDHIWHNFDRQYAAHYGGNRYIDGIYSYYYCDQKALPAKVQAKLTGSKCRYNSRKARGQAAVTWNDAGRFWSNVYVLLCPVFLGTEPGAPAMATLQTMKYDGDSWNEVRKTIDRWGNTVRGVTLYHETAHWELLSWPACQGNEEYNPHIIASKALYGGREGYKFNIRNAHSWALSAVAMWMMKRWPEIGVPKPVRPIPKTPPIDGLSADDGP
uniref:chitinase n=1 Tax=Hirsutella thompsonii TaxID=42368 RepID=A0A097F8M8_HIRTH|nr:chitinase [Hirsutella thompsonii]